MELQLNGLPDKLVHVARFGREDLDVLESNVVIMVHPTFRNRQFFWMPKLNVPLMLFYSGLDQAISLSDVNLATFTGDAVHTRSPQPQVILHRVEEARDFPRWQANTPDIVLGRHCAEAAISRLDIWQEGN
jgi:hypothetical protein